MDNYPVEIHEKKNKKLLTNLIPNRVKVWNIEDIEGFVNDCIAKLPQLKKMDQQERDEITSEGIAILFDLAKKYKPKMEGYEKEGTFSGYAGMYLPMKILTAWYKMHPEHVQRPVVQEDGTVKRLYVHGDKPFSLDSIQSSRRNRSDESGSKDFDLVDGRMRTVGDFVQ